MPKFKLLLMCLLLMVACAAAKAQIIVNNTMTALSTTYGTESASTSFTVSGINMYDAIKVTAPAGLQVSTDDINFSTVLTIGAAGNIPPTLVYVRFGVLSNAGAYNGRTVDLSCPNTTTVKATLPNSQVAKFDVELKGDFGKIYGEKLTNYTLYFNSPFVPFNNALLKNGNTFYSMDVEFSVGANSNDPVNVYPTAVKVTPGSFKGASGFSANNYNIIYTGYDLIVQPAPLSIKANNTLKPYGTTLTNQAGSVNFTAEGLKNGETVGSVTITYTAGYRATDAVGDYSGSIDADLATGGTFNASNYAITYLRGNLEIIQPNAPALIKNTLPVAVNTDFGTPSPSTSFTFSGAYLSGPVSVIPPPGFEAGTDNINFSGNPLLINGGSTINNQRVYIRLAVNTNVKIVNSVIASYSGDIEVRNGSALIKIAMPASRVEPVEIKLKAPSKTKEYGERLDDYHTAPAGIYESGLKNGNTLDEVGVAYNEGAAANADVALSPYYNQVDAFATKGSNGYLPGNYKAQLTNGSIIVTKAPFKITMKDEEKTYGQTRTNTTGWTDFNHTLKNNEKPGSVNITYLAGGNANAPVQDYVDAIEGTGLAGGTYKPGNYTAPQFFKGTLHVKPATLTVKIDDASREFKTANPTFTYTYSGFVNGETESIITGTPVLSTTATLNSPAGKYPITLSGISAPNYTIVYEEGTLTVKSALKTLLATIPSAFTPNGDGINDVWNIGELANYYPKFSARVFNRNGQEVFRSVGYSIPWDATFKGANLPSGAYYYIIDLRDGSKPTTGNISIIR